MAASTSMQQAGSSSNVEVDGFFRKLDATVGTQVHVQALDEVMSVNAYFTVAVFIGMAFTSPQQGGSSSLVEECRAGPDTPKTLLVREVVSFACYLFSSLVAQGLKLLIVLLNAQDLSQAFSASLRPLVLRLGMLASALGTITGTFFLTLSIVSLVEMRLGLMTCGSAWAAAAIIPLVIMVSIGLLIFISTAVYAFIA